MFYLSRVSFIDCFSGIMRNLRHIPLYFWLYVSVIKASNVGAEDIGLNKKSWIKKGVRLFAAS